MTKTSRSEFADNVMKTGLWKEPEKLYAALLKQNAAEKFEKIEKMAWELFLKSPDKNGWTLSDCWKVATQFYDYAKQKQEEAEKFYEYAKEKEGNEDSKEFPCCTECKKELICGAYDGDINGHKFCSKRCMLKYAAVEQREKNDD